MLPNVNEKWYDMVWAFDLGKGSIGDIPSPRWGDLSRLGNGERSSAAPKARSGPNEWARVSQRGRRPDEGFNLFDARPHLNPLPRG